MAIAPTVTTALAPTAAINRISLVLKSFPFLCVLDYQPHTLRFLHFVNSRCVFIPGNPLGSEPDAGLTSKPSNSIIERAAEAVDVIRDSDQQRGLSKVTPFLRR
jgi:hypothetical protein